MINWDEVDTSGEDLALIGKIAERAEELALKHGHKYDRTCASMDLEVVHALDVRLDLAGLLQADDYEFAHDVFGIRRRLDRESGKLTECFCPRFAQTGAAV